MSNTNMDTVNEIGLAVIGCGTIGRIRAKYAREYPGVKWLGLCDINELEIANFIEPEIKTFLNDLAKVCQLCSSLLLACLNTCRIFRLQARMRRKGHVPGAF